MPLVKTSRFCEGVGVALTQSQNGTEPPAVVRIMSEGNEVPALWVLFRQARTGSGSRCSTLDCGEGVSSAYSLEGVAKCQGVEEYRLLKTW